MKAIEKKSLGWLTIGVVSSSLQWWATPITEPKELIDLLPVMAHAIWFGFNFVTVIGSALVLTVIQVLRIKAKYLEYAPSKFPAFSRLMKWFNTDD